MKQMILLPLLVVSSLGFTACSKSSKSKAPTRTQITVLGDPLKVVGAATLSPDYSADAFQDGESLFLLSVISFEEEGKYIPGKNVDIESENKTAGRGSAKESSADDYTFKVRIKAPGHLVLENKNEGFELVKEARGFSANVLNDNTTESQLLHTSISADKNTVSFLIYSQDKATKKRALTAIYLARSSKVNLVRTSAPYEYLRGTGIKIPWAKNSTVELNLCNSDSQVLAKHTKDSIASWQSVLGDRLKVNYKGSTSHYPPFTDLNYRCIYLADGYMSHPNPQVGRFAVTATVPNVTKSEITDSDVIIFKNEFGKTGYHSQDEFSRYLLRVVLHELGHFFGLGHQFNGTRSIMAYKEYGYPQIEEHDKEAIQALYE